jgi:MFS family permease
LSIAINSSIPGLFLLNPVSILATGKMSNNTTESASTTTIVEPNDQDLPTRTGTEAKCIEQVLDSTIESASNLPPMDKGKGAYLFLTAAFTVEALAFGSSPLLPTPLPLPNQRANLTPPQHLGLAFSYGRFQSYYTTTPPFSSYSSAAVIGVLNQGLILICMPPIVHLARRKPVWARWMATAGLLGCVVSNIASSFCRSIPQLMFTQGVLLGVSGSIAFCPLLIFADQWFDKKKGLAFGVIGAGSGFGGLVLPLLINFFLTRTGFQTTMRLLAAILAGVGIPLAYFIRPRLPPPSPSSPAKNSKAKKRFWNWRLIRSRSFLLHQVANLVQGAGYYLPGIYLPSFTRDAFGASDWLSTLSLMLLNLSAMLGLVVMGHMTDRYNSRTCIAISAMGATLSVFLFWGLATHIAVLYIFCVLFGLFAGGFPAAWPAVMREMAEKGEKRGFGHVDTILVFSLFCVARGVGSLASGPLSETLVDGMPWKEDAIGGYGSGYGALVVFCGVSSLISGVNALWYHLP